MSRFPTIACLLVFASVSVIAADPVKSELDGTWNLVSYNDNGRDNEEDAKKGYVLTRANGVQTITVAGKEVDKSTFVVDSKSTPKTITFKGKDGKDTNLGIYTLEGDSLTIATFSDAKKQATERPVDVKPGPGKVVAKYRKAK